MEQPKPLFVTVCGILHGGSATKSRARGLCVSIVGTRSLLSTFISNSHCSTDSGSVPIEQY